MRRFIFAFLAVLPLAVGCGGSGGDTKPKFKVTGTVKLNGAPLDTGTIMFESDPPDGRMASAPISAGSYTLEATAGKKTVRISREVMKEIDMGGEKMKISEETLPTRYNSESTLKAEVKTEGDNVFDFALKK